jgi:hypothetical protein
MKSPGGRSPFSVSVHTSIEGVDRSAWNSLVENTLFHTTIWMKLLEVSLQEQVIPLYITVYEDDLLVGAGICYYTMEKKYGIPIPVINCTYPLSEAMALFTREPDDRDVFSVLVDTVESIAHNRKAKAIIITKSPGGLYGEMLRERAYHHLHLIPTTYLDIPWNTFQDYLKSLPRKAKKNIRHTLNQGRRKGLRIIHSQDFSDIEHLYDLFEAAMDRHGHQHLIPCTLDVFQNFARYVPEYTYVARCYHGDDLLGYWMYFFDGDFASLAISGIDKTYSKEYNTYFNICYDTIREMIERNCKRAWFGITTYEVKRRIGCTIQPTAVSVKLCNPLLNMLLNPVVAFRNYYLRKTYGG